MCSGTPVSGFVYLVLEREVRALETFLRGGFGLQSGLVSKLGI